MKSFEQTLNSLLIETFRDILKVEELILQRSDPNLSISEVHLIESVRKGNNRSGTVTEIAADLKLSMPSVTVAVNKLVKKGYLFKEKDVEDARSVKIRLTREGEKIYRLHMFFHQKLVRQAAAELNELEKDALLAGVENLDNFFKKKIAKYGGLNEFSNRRNWKGNARLHSDQ